VRVGLDRKATSLSVLVALGVRRDGQKVLLALRNMGGESQAAWRALLDDLVSRGLATPELLIVDGAAGLEKAVAALWSNVPVQRCTVDKHRKDRRGGGCQAQSLSAQMAAALPPGRDQPGRGR
jgi:transposase-like protein